MSGRDWSWDGSYDKRGGKGSGKGKGSYSSYKPEWQDWGSGGGKGKGKGAGQVRDNGLNGTVSNLAWMMEQDMTTKWEEKQAAEKLKKEETERLAKEREAEERKKERDDFYERVKEDHKEQMEKLGKNLGGSPGAGRSAVSPTPSGGAADLVDFDNYKDALRAPKRQVSQAPVDPKVWVAWRCTDATTAKILRAFPGTVTKEDLLNEGLLACAESINACATCPNKTLLREQYTNDVGEDALTRWGKVDILVGLLAHLVKA